MDWSDLKRRANAAREFTHTVAGRSFTLRLPTAHELRVAVLEHGSPDMDSGPGLAAWERIGRALIVPAIVGWSNVRVADLLAGGEDEEIDYAPDGVALLLDAQPEWAAELRLAFNTALIERNARLQDAKKN